MRKIGLVLVVTLLLAVVPAVRAQMGDGHTLQITLAATPFAEGSGLAAVSGTAYVDIEKGTLRIELAPNGAALPAGAVLEGWMVDAGLAGGPGTSHVSDADETYGVPFGSAEFDAAVESAPYALSTGILAEQDGLWVLDFSLPNANFSPYDAVVVTLESDGNSTSGYDPRPGTPVFAGLIADGVTMGMEPTRPAWQTIALTDVRTGEVFTLADLAGRAVMIEPMATWCGNCARQQGNVRDAKAQLNSDEVLFISLSVETSLPQADLAAYADSKGFDWIFAVATPDLLSELVNQFGGSITNPPSTPHFVIYPDGTWSDLKTGFNSPDELIALARGS
jgi:hypothetical protein